MKLIDNDEKTFSGKACCHHGFPICYPLLFTDRPIALGTSSIRHPVSELSW